jgi:hypothetical protein
MGPALMGKRGFLRREASPKEVLEHRLRLAREVAPPTPKVQRGRPWRYDHGLYLGPLLFRAFFYLTHRKTEALLRDLMEAPFPSHGSLARHAAQHLDLKLLEALLERLSRELEAHLSSRDSPEEDPAPPRRHGVGLPEGGPVSPLPSGSGGAAGPGARAASGPGAVGEGEEVAPALGWGGGERLRPGPPARGEGQGGGAGAGAGGVGPRGVPGAYLWERRPWTAMVRAFLEPIAYDLRVLLSLLPPLPGYKAIHQASPPGPRPEVAGHPPLPQGGPPQGEGGLLDGDEEPGGAGVGGGVRKDDCGYRGLPASRGPEAEGGKGA